jgi:probable lipoprotein (TIGR04455 family)
MLTSPLEGAAVQARVDVVNRPLLVILFLCCIGCSVVKSHQAREDWPHEDHRRVKRLAVVVHPLPAGSAKAGETFARIARRYVNMKREFLVKQEVVQADAPKPESLCGTDERIEGLLLLDVRMQPRGGGFEVDLLASLARCPDLRPAWTARAAGSFPSMDPGLREVTAVYVRELGPEAERFVAPAMNVLRPTLDTLPQPELDEDDKNEKMSLD